MLKGKIISLNKGFGFIKPSADGEDVYFHSSCLQGIQFNELKEGITIEYEWEKGPRGPRANIIKIPGCINNKQIHEYRFLNPYNFVRYLSRNRPPKNVLGDCPPPPHDRYMGLTGRINCKVETKTPLFISDSHNVRKLNRENHKSYRFFQYNGKQALPASSLRGMIRSVYEAITNSCFAALQIDNPYPLEHGLSSAPNKMIPARTSPRQDCIPSYLFHCKSYEHLCPACRLFGWVQKNGKDLGKNVAYAGRIRFSHGKMQKSEGTDDELTLAILSTPKPTSTEFYLLDPSGKPDPLVDYNTKGARLRGRKFYHHQVQTEDYSTKEKGDQNRTVRDTLKPGAIFSFNIDFENLNQLELGALIYALELEEGLYHRLGYAKPLGFGSVKISIKKIETINWGERLTSAAPGAGWKPLDNRTVLQLRQTFLKEIRKIYDEESITDLQAELRAILGKQNIPIHYPRPTRQPDSEAPSFEWFVGNKKRKRPGKRKLPHPECLPKATRISRGLPLIDKHGKPGK